MPSGVSTGSISGRATTTERNTGSGLFTKRFGNRSMARYLTAQISTIKTIIHSITIPATTPVSQESSISTSISTNPEKRECGNWLQSRANSQRRGTLLQKVVNGIGRMAGMLWPIECRWNWCVSNAAMGSPRFIEDQNFVPITANPLRAESAGRTMRLDLVRSAGSPSNATDTYQQKHVPVHVVRVYQSGRGTVYNLSVSGPEEYFANGILVHNCRYLLVSFRNQALPEPFRALQQRRIASAREHNPSIDTAALVYLNKKLEADHARKNNARLQPIHVLRPSRNMRARVKGLLGPVGA